MEDTPLLDFVLAELRARRGSWPVISKSIAGDDWRSHYSWMSKLTQEDVIGDPGVRKIQALADYFRDNPREEAAA